MARDDDSWLNPSKREANQLNAVIQDGASPETEDMVILDEKLRERTHEEEKIKHDAVNTVHTDTATDEEASAKIKLKQARSEAPILEHTSARSKVRLLVITKDASIFDEGSISRRRISDLRGMFLEIHVIVLTQAESSGTDEPVIRVFENIWLYPTRSSSWWTMGYDAYTIANSQLVFSGGFRADLVVAEDLFEAGIVGWLLSQKYERSFQVHVYDDFFDAAFVEAQEHPTLFEWSIRYLLAHVTSIRTKTEFQRQAIINRHKDLEEVTEVLPSYYNLDVWRDFVPTVNLREKFPQFRFILLHVSSMRTSSHAREVLLGSAKMLRRYATIGLVMVGNGPLRAMLEREAIALGLQKQVEFLPMPAEVISYMKTANVLIHLSEDGGEDDFILQAAVAKLPLIANKGGLAGKLFVHEESACLCAPDDIACISENINRYLNENQDRARYALNASEIVFERIEQDYDSYLTAYAESIERVMATLAE